MANVIYKNPSGMISSIPVKEGEVVEIPKGVKLSDVIIQQEPSTGSRYNEGKPEMSMVLEANKAIEGVAKVLMYGKAKYHRGNWLGGLAHMGIVDCLMRHLTAYVAGEDKDAESGLLHVDHVLANALFLSQMYHTRPDLDDRVKL